MALADILPPVLAPVSAPVFAVVWAQLRTSRNFFLRANKSGLAVRWLMNLLWYGAWVLAAAGGGFLVSGRIPGQNVERALPGAFFLVCFFWQLFPVVLASQGAFIDLRRLLAYPIPPSQLFLLETALRVSTAIEVILICLGLAVGFLFNPNTPLWGLLGLFGLMSFNLLLATGVKSLLDRLFRKKGIREVIMLIFLGLIILPQLLVASLENAPLPSLAFLKDFTVAFRAMPWSAAASIATGHPSGLPVASLLAANAAAFLFARLQFTRTLLLEDTAGSPTAKPAAASPFDRLAALPALVFPDPVAALIEKDIRTLARAPRFRLIFLMSATFGAVLWLPQVLRDRSGWLAQNYLTMAALYGMLVLGEVLYWNVFGFERAGAQHWFATPVRFTDVLRAKNAVAVLFTGFAFSILAIISVVLPVGVSLPQLADSLAAACVFLTCILAAGNLTSVYMPRPVDAEQAWRNSASKSQFLLLLFYPILSTPVVLAHLARWATQSYWAYHGVLAVSFVIALCFYYVATESAAEAAEKRKEDIVATLSRHDGPVSLST